MNHHDKGNGRPAIPFHARPNIPIVGEPFTFQSWFPTVLVRCNCEAQSALLIIGGAIVVCPACRRQVAVGRILFDVVAGSLEVSLRHAAPEPTEAG